MESAPLTRGHAHVRTAARLGRSSKSDPAMNEHLLAAGEFAQAAKATADEEASPLESATQEGSTS